MNALTDFTDLGMTIGWMWVAGIGLVILGLGAIGLVLGLLMREWRLGLGLFASVAAVSLLFLGPWLGFRIVAEPHNTHNFAIEGVVEEVTNSGVSSEGDISYRTYVVSLDMTEVPLVTTDPRVLDYKGEAVRFTCTPEFVFRGADRMECVIAEVLR